MQSFPDITQLGCAGVLGAVADPACPEAKASEISYLYVSEVDSAAPALPKYFPTDPTLAADWNTAIDNAGTGIKSFKFVGAMPVAPENVVRVGEYVLQLPRRYQVTGRIIDVSEANYLFYRTLQAGQTIHIWFKTKGKRLFGASNEASAIANAYHPYGIQAKIINWHIDLPEGDNAVESIQVTLEWDATGDPPHIPVSPI